MIICDKNMRSIVLGNACMTCEKCKDELKNIQGNQGKFVTVLSLREGEVDIFLKVMNMVNDYISEKYPTKKSMISTRNGYYEIGYIE